MKFKFLIIIVSAFIFCLPAKAQQIEQFSQYMFNKFVINPAASGLKKDLRVRLTYRNQWLGAFDGEQPTTYMLSATGRSEKMPNVGLGLNIFADVTGPTSRTGLDLNYAYNIDLPKTKSKLSFGLAATVLQYNLNTSALNPLDPNDAAIFEANNSKIGADADFGVYIENKNYYVGFSVAQIFNNKFVLTSDTIGYLRLARHYYLMAGYEYDLADKLVLQPMFLIKSIEPAPMQYEIGALFYYDKKYWLGCNYRTEDAIAILAGLKITDNWKLGYSYDVGTSKINQIATGAHEILLEYRFADLNF